MEKAGTRSRSLWVCFAEPGEPPEAGQPLLSFLPPPAEERLAAGAALTRARLVTAAVRAKARSRYLRLVAAIGAARCRDGRTLRERMAASGGASPWWYHPVSFKDPDGTADRAYERILYAEAVRAEAERVGARRLVVWGAHRDLVDVLAQSFDVEARRTLPAPRLWLSAARALASRLRSLWTHLRHIAAARRLREPAGTAEVGLFGFWDWSAWAAEGGVADRYYKKLPAEMTKAGLAHRWLLWLDPAFEPGKGGRSLASVLAPAAALEGVTILQSLLEPADALGASLDLGPARAWWAERDAPGVRGALVEDGVDYLPIFRERLVYGFLDGTMPRMRLAALAAERACRRLGLAGTLSFLEHYSFGRAFHEGARRGGARVAAAMQHASVCRDKTFYAFEPGVEFRGEPDGRGVPAPDVFFAMGGFGKELAEEAGHPPQRVLLTGSARYDGVRPPAESSPPRPTDGLRILVAVTLEAALELEMLEAAVAATEGMPGVSLSCRNYPFTRIETHARFAPLARRVAVTSGTLEQDLAAADVVLFTYSTVGEEALIYGRPAWQWLPTGYNGSALAEVERVPRFGSVRDLREAIESYRAQPERFIPSVETRRRVLGRLFFKADGGNAARIAASLKELLAAAPQKLQ